MAATGSKVPSVHKKQDKMTTNPVKKAKRPKPARDSVKGEGRAPANEHPVRNETNRRWLSFACESSSFADSVFSAQKTALRFAPSEEEEEEEEEKTYRTEKNLPFAGKEEPISSVSEESLEKHGCVVSERETAFPRFQEGNLVLRRDPQHTELRETKSSGWQKTSAPENVLSKFLENNNLASLVPLRERQDFSRDVIERELIRAIDGESRASEDEGLRISDSGLALVSPEALVPADSSYGDLAFDLIETPENDFPSEMVIASPTGVLIEKILDDFESPVVSGIPDPVVYAQTITLEDPPAFEYASEEPMEMLSKVFDLFTDLFGEPVVKDFPGDSPWVALNPSPRTELRDEKFFPSKSSENNLASSLMGDIDLHLELQNYLKAMDEEIGSSKLATKKSLPKNTELDGCSFGFENRLGSNQTAEFEVNGSTGIIKEPFDGDTGRTLFEINSGSSLVSATSVATLKYFKENDVSDSLDHLSANQKRRVFAESDFSKLRAPKTSASQSFIQALEASVLVDKDITTEIRSEGAPRKARQGAKSESCIKRSFGKTSFRLSETEAKNPLVRSSCSHKDLLSSFYGRGSRARKTDEYEKIAPLSNRSLNEKKNKKKSASDILSENSERSLSLESLRRPRQENIISVPTHSLEIRCRETSSSESARSDPNEDVVRASSPTTRSLNDEVLACLQVPRSGIDETWSPTLQELIEIYHGVLKQNNKLKRSSRTSMKRCLSASLFSYLDKQLVEKKIKSDIIKFSRSLSPDLKLENGAKILKDGWKTGSEKRELEQLEKFVNIFQEILSSSLSIDHITRLNNIVADLQYYSNRDRFASEHAKEKTRRKEEGKKETDAKGTAKPVKIESADPHKKSAAAKSKQTSEKVSNKELKTKFKTDEKLAKEKPASTAVAAAAAAAATKNITRFPKKLTAPNKSQPSDVKEIKLPEFRELSTLLKSYLSSDVRNSSSRSGAPEIKNKILVTVTLNGDKVLVNGMWHFENENSIAGTTKIPTASDYDGTSELIIENVTKENINKPTTKLKFPNVQKKKPCLGKSSFEKPNKEIEKTRRREEATDKSETKKTKLPSGQTSQDKTNVSNTFEYNQQRLKAQHPIEAIIESSEWKMDKIAGKNDDDDVSLSVEEAVESNAKTKFRKKTEVSKEWLKEILKEVLIGNYAFSKDFIEDFNSNFLEHEPYLKSVDRTKSCVIRRSETKSNGSADQDINATGKHVKSMIETSLRDTTKRPVRGRKKVRKAHLSRPHTNYVCFPFLENFQSPKSKKKPREIKDRRIAPEPGPTKSTAGASRPGREFNWKKSLLRGVPKKSEELAKPSTKEGSLQKHHSDYQTRSSEMQSDQRQKPIPGSQGAQAPATDKTDQWTKPTTKSSTDTILSVNSQTSPQYCSVEFLFDDKVGSNFTASSSESSSVREVQETSADSVQKAPSAGAELLAGAAKYFNVNPTSSVAVVKAACGSPVVLHSPKSHDDDVSEMSLMISSDSFLRYCTPFLWWKSENYKPPVLAASSELKFYPGRVVDESEEQVPLVTFVLTPEQQQTTASGVPSNQIKVATKKPELSDDEFKGQENEVTENKESKTEDEPALNSASKLVDRLSEPIVKMPNQKKTRTTRRKSVIPCRRLQDLKTIKRTSYHDYQKKKTTEGKSVYEKSGGGRQNSAPNFAQESRTRRADEGSSDVDREASPAEFVETEDLAEEYGDAATDDRDVFYPAIGENVERKHAKDKLFEDLPENGERSAPKSKFIFVARTETKTFDSPSSKNSLERSAPAPELDIVSSEKTDQPRPSSALTDDFVENSTPDLRPAAASNDITSVSSFLTRLSRGAPLSAYSSSLIMKIVKDILNLSTNLDNKQDVIAVIEDYVKNLANFNDFKDANSSGEPRKRKDAKAVGNKSPKAPKSQPSSSRNLRTCNAVKTPRVSVSCGKKSAKTIKIKIHCDDQNADRPSGNTTGLCARQGSPPPKKAKLNRSDESFLPLRATHHSSVDILDSLIARDEEEELQRKESVYFDAEETFGDATGGNDATDCPGDTDGSTTAPTANTATRTPSVDLTASQLKLFSDNLADHWEEKVFEKIMSNLEENDVCRAMSLLDNLMKKSGQVDSIQHPLKLFEMLQAIENKSRDLMAFMEKNGWSKILSLLDDVSRSLFETGCGRGDDAESLDYSKKQLDMATKFLRKIQILNPPNQPSEFLTSTGGRPVSLPAPRPDSAPSVGLFNVLSRIKDSFCDLKNKFFLSSRRRLFGRRTSFQKYSDEDDDDDRSPPSLKRQIRNQRLFVQHLIDSDDCGQPDIREIKIQVADKLKALEKIVSGFEKAPKEKDWKSLDSGLDVKGQTSRDACRTRVTGNEGPETSDFHLNKHLKKSGCRNLMKSLIKVWDSRSCAPFSGNCGA